MIGGVLGWYYFACCFANLLVPSGGGVGFKFDGVLLFYFSF